MAKKKLTPKQQAILDDKFPPSGEMPIPAEKAAMKGKVPAKKGKIPPQFLKKKGK
jgi:hypothetical protein